MLSDIIQLGNQLIEYNNKKHDKKMNASFISLQLYLECKINTLKAKYKLSPNVICQGASRIR